MVGASMNVCTVSARTNQKCMGRSVEGISTNNYNCQIIQLRPETFQYILLCCKSRSGTIVGFGELLTPGVLLVSLAKTRVSV